ncbi:MAG: hypothetical protein KGI29_02330 [Pseudomonadota bacterium]|nr:hypothetical protein [Pseudomonadota bacterium]
MDWYRAYHGMPQDTKLKVIAHRTKQPMASVLSVWVCLLDMASQNNPRGNVVIDAEQIAVLQNLETEDVIKIINGFYEKNLLTAENRLTSWDKRQYTSPTERSKKSRAKTQRDAASCNAMQRDATPGNAAQQKSTQKKTDTERDNRLQNSEAENRSQSAEPEKEAEVEAEKDLKKDSDKKLRAREEKGEREREKQKIGGQATDQKPDASGTLLQMLDVWNSEVQSKLTRGQKAILTPKRKEQMTLRWLEDFQQDMRAWQYYCQVIGASDFCLGKIEGKGWTIDLNWAVESSDHVAKILEGGFSGGNHPPKPPACNVIALQEAWGSVLRSFEQKYSRDTCRSWLANTVVTNTKSHSGRALATLQCPSKFVVDWITRHYLADLNRWFAEATKTGARVTGVELTTEG